MKILFVQPVRIEGIGITVKGLVDVVYKKGFLKKKTVKRRAYSYTGILWHWLDNGETDWDVTEIVRAACEELIAGKVIDVEFNKEL